MATPSSSATSASPPLAYMTTSAVPSSQSTTTSTPTDPLEREQRKKAVQKFLARAEISMVTRALRARLSYASYKATHNIPHVPLRDLEAQTQAHHQGAPSRTNAAKRKASATNAYYNNPATHSYSGPSAGPSIHRRGAMAPPTTTSSGGSRVPFPPANGAMSSHTTSANRSTNPTQSLYSSILAPPPAKQARTIHNVSDPPLQAAQRPTHASPGSRSHGASKGSVRSIAEGTRAQARNRGDGKVDKRPSKRSTHKGKQRGADLETDADVDMKAAATLTSLLMQARPSITSVGTGSASSPRSSLGDVSETGSVHSYSHFAQSSARTITSAPTLLASALTTNAADPSFAAPSNYRPLTPPPGPVNLGMQTTPRPAPTDNEAADLMLFLATSPSPARPTTTRDKDAKDLAAFRALGGPPGSLRAKGRVLFPSSVGGGDAPSGPTLSRGGADSFTSSISSIGSDMRGAGGSMLDISSSERPLSAVATPSASLMHVPTPSQLLPPPPSPSAKPSSPEPTKKNPPTPGSSGFAAFNFNDFINVSPSPRGSVSSLGQGKGSLRADVGRKLFEEEQMRHQAQMQIQHRQNVGAGTGSEGAIGQGVVQDLGAGIDLVQS